MNSKPSSDHHPGGALPSVPAEVAAERRCDCRWGYVPSDDAKDAAKYRAINTPEIGDFMVAIEREALHQRERWASEHDAGKTDADWFWLVGYLAGKAINKPDKRLHHIITTAAACLNWHAHALGTHQQMRPGIGPDKQPPKPKRPRP